jgi:hypothetical protein
MSRINGTFQYQPVAQTTEDESTGFVTQGNGSEWLDGGECQIDRSIPATNYVGTDGQTYSYTYDVFVPRAFDGVLEVGTILRLTLEDGTEDTITAQGVDVTRKYIEVWG